MSTMDSAVLMSPLLVPSQWLLISLAMDRWKWPPPILLSLLSTDIACNTSLMVPMLPLNRPVAFGQPVFIVWLIKWMLARWRFGATLEPSTTLSIWIMVCMALCRLPQALKSWSLMTAIGIVCCHRTVMPW